MWRRRNRELEAEAAYVDDTVGTWERACSLVGLTRKVDTVSGGTEVTPRVEFVGISERFLSVRLLPGQVPADYTAVGDRLAYAMGAAAIRVEPRAKTHVIIRLLDTDPLDVNVTAPRAGAADAPVLVAQDENGAAVHLDIPSVGHMAVQGTTGGGKSVFLYSVLGQLAERQSAGYPLVVNGIDPSGILLRPFPGSVLGLTNPVAVEAYLTDACRDMDKRIASIPADRDSLPIDQDNPLRFVVMEELPGLWRWLDALDPKAAKRCRALLCRLLAEGRKAGYRVILVAQRAESAVIGATERAQCSVRVSFRVDTVDSLRMLHPDADVPTAEAHSRAPSGVALVSIPGRSLTRARAPYVDYATYARGVQS
jgi:S-DNA-T family DNA segregation ATPase FtsK/SpoIIIE